MTHGPRETRRAVRGGGRVRRCTCEPRPADLSSRALRRRVAPTEEARPLGRTRRRPQDAPRGAAGAASARAAALKSEAWRPRLGRPVGAASHARFSKRSASGARCRRSRFPASPVAPPSRILSEDRARGGNARLHLGCAGAGREAPTSGPGALRFLLRCPEETAFRPLAATTPR